MSFREFYSRFIHESNGISWIEIPKTLRREADAVGVGKLAPLEPAEIGRRASAFVIFSDFIQPVSEGYYDSYSSLVAMAACMAGPNKELPYIALLRLTTRYLSMPDGESILLQPH
jgi:hypothetical protein